MYTFLLVLLVLDSIVLMAAVLAQAGKGGGLSATFGGAGTAEFMGMRQASTMLTKASWWAGGIFMALAFILGLMSVRTVTPRSILDQPLSAPATTAPTTPSPIAPAVPLEPAPATGDTTRP